MVGKKGYLVLDHFIAKYGSANVAFVVASRDRGQLNDCFEVIKGLCQSKNIVFINKPEINDSILPKVKYRFCIGWRWMIPDTNNLIVMHDSPLPKYRGFAPLVNMLINGEKKLAVTALYASSEYDKGEILSSRSVGIVYPLKIQDAIEIIIPLYIECIDEVYDKFLGESLIGIKQEEKEATYSVWRDEYDYRINWSDSAEDIVRFCNAVGYPYMGANTTLDGEMINIMSVCEYPNVQVESRMKHVGKIIFFNHDNPVVICGDGLVELLAIKKDGKEISGRSISFRTRFGN